MSASTFIIQHLLCYSSMSWTWKHDVVELCLFEEIMVQYLQYTFLVFPKEHCYHLTHYWTFLLNVFFWGFPSVQLEQMARRFRLIRSHLNPPKLARNPEASQFGSCRLTLDKSLWMCPMLYWTLWWRIQKLVHGYGLEALESLFSICHP